MARSPKSRGEALFTASMTRDISPLEAMEKLHRGSVYDYDPDVVAVLRRMLERRGEFDRPRARA